MRAQTTTVLCVITAHVLNVFVENRVSNEILRALSTPKHSSGQSPVQYRFFQSTDVVVNTNLFLFGFQFPGLIDVVIPTVPVNENRREQ